MSRIRFENDEYIFAYGVDFLNGIFIQIYSKEKGGECHAGYLVGLNQRENNLSLQDMILAGQVFGFDLSDEGNLIPKEGAPGDKLTIT